jgi:hypothetical protein
MIVLMANDTHELLFLVASEFVELNHLQKMNIGVRLKLIDFGGFCRTEASIEEMVFCNAFRKNMISQLVEEIQRIKYEPSKPG